MAEYAQQDFKPSLADELQDAFDHDPSVERVNTPIWREVIWPTEWLRLRTSAVYFGIDIPKGKQQPVMLVPGFMSSDLTMLELQRWLKRIGYDAHLSRIVFNTDCPNQTARELISRIKSIHKKTGQKVSLIGHSLGGMLSKSIAQTEPELVDRVITLGSPFASLVKAHPSVVGIWEHLKNSSSGLIGRNLKPSCATGYCTCGFVKSMLMPQDVDVPQFAVYSKKDGVADWQSCIEDDPSANTEVNSTHIGMIFHPEVYRVIAQRLAQKKAA
ncbi:MAG: triacylglycerol lipase [Pseudohongiellaceae bacterium]